MLPCERTGYLPLKASDLCLSVLDYALSPALHRRQKGTQRSTSGDATAITCLTLLLARVQPREGRSCRPHALYSCSSNMLINCGVGSPPSR